MSQEPNDSQQDSLEDVASRLSGVLPGQPVEISQTTVDTVTGGQVRMVDSSARHIEAHALHLESSAAALVKAGSVEVNQGAIALAFTDQATLKETNATLLVARTLKARKVRSLVLIAGRIEGDVQTLLTPAAAFTFGGAFALVFWLLGKFRKNR